MTFILILFLEEKRKRGKGVKKKRKCGKKKKNQSLRYSK
jgi:hypothetical protein